MTFLDLVRYPLVACAGMVVAYAIVEVFRYTNKDDKKNEYGTPINPISVNKLSYNKPINTSTIVVDYKNKMTHIAIPDKVRESYNILGVYSITIFDNSRLNQTRIRLYDMKMNNNELYPVIFMTDRGREVAIRNLKLSKVSDDVIDITVSGNYTHLLYDKEFILMIFQKKEG